MKNMKNKNLNIYERADGRFEARYFYTKLGEKKCLYKYGKTSKEAKEKLLEAIKTIDKVCPKSHKSVNFLFGEFLSSLKHKVKESTLAGYIMKFETHISPEFGVLNYDKVSLKTVENFAGKLLENGLSKAYVADILILTKTFGKFVHKHYGFQNPFSEIELHKSEKKEAELLSSDEQSKLVLSALECAFPIGLCILLGYFMGLRIGEICVLKWSDIDLTNGFIRINKTVQRIKKIDGKGTKLMITSPKTANSNRTVFIPQNIKNILEILKNHKKNDNFYLASGTEKIAEPRTVQYRFEAFLKKANLPKINFHLLRHMFATNCAENPNFDIKTLSEILGHSDVQTTLRKYVHSSEKRKRECMNLVTFGVALDIVSRQFMPSEHRDFGSVQRFFLGAS